MQKLDVCAIKFDFENADPAHNRCYSIIAVGSPYQLLILYFVFCRGKDMKRETLLELVDFVNNAGGQKVC